MPAPRIPASRPCRDRDAAMLQARRARRERRSNAARTGRSTSRRRRRWRAKAARRRPLHNNCSGKHAGFSASPARLGADRGSYVEPDHPVQRAVKATLEDLTGAALVAGRLRAPTAARCRPGRAAASAGARLCAASAPASASRPTAPGPPRGSATPAPRIPGMSPAPAGSAPRHGALRRAGVRQDRRGGRLLRGAAGAGLGIAREMRRRRRPRRRGDDGGVCCRASCRSTTDARALEPFVRPILRNWNGIATGEIRPTKRSAPEVVSAASIPAYAERSRSWNGGRRSGSCGRDLAGSTSSIE